MNAYLGSVSAVDDGARRVQVSLPHLATLTRFLRFGSPIGLISPLPSVGDEVLVICTGADLADAVVTHWIPTADQVADAQDRPLVASTSGDVPTQADPDQEIGDAAVTGVLAR